MTLLNKYNTQRVCDSILLPIILVIKPNICGVFDEKLEMCYKS